MDQIQKTLLEEIADLHEVPAGAYNIRANGAMAGRNTTANIDIVTKEDKQGIDIIIKPGTKNESVHIPVVLSQSGIEEMVYNDFHIGDDCDVTIVAGCGIHNGGDKKSQHDGIHSFFIGKNSKVKYVEKHYGQGEGTGERIMNPHTVIEIDEDSYMEMETVQIKGVDSTDRITTARLADRASIKVIEKLVTHGSQYAKTSFEVELDGEIDLIIQEDGILYPVEIKMTASPKATMASVFDILDGVADKKRGMGAIICLYDKKLYLRENLVALPIEYI